MKQILLVDDNPGDIDLMRRALAEVGTGISVEVAENGVQGFVFLRHKTREQLPNVIVLDFNMPVFDGIKVLEILHESETLRSIPVVVFTSSMREKDRTAAMRAGAKCVTTKPLTWEGYVQLAHKLVDFLASPRPSNEEKLCL
mgnify:CR=1 FL=1